MGITMVLSLLSGVALFLYGMSLMGDSLKKVAGNKLELILYRLTNTPLKGLLLGTVVTAIIQSSSATTVMVVGFVNSGMMKVAQAIGIIMGANIGTSITGWILCLSYIDGSSGIAQLLSTATISAIVAIIGIIFRTFIKKKPYSWLCDPDDRNADHERCCLSSERESAFRQTSDHVHESIYGNPCRDRIYSSFAECFCFCRYPPGTVHYRIDHLCSCTSDHNGYRRWRRMSGSSFLNRNEQERKAYCSDLSAERFIWYDFLVHRILFCKCHRAFPIYGWNYVTFPCGTFEYGIPASDDPCSCSIYRQDWKACLLPY